MATSSSPCANPCWQTPRDEGRVVSVTSAPSTTHARNARHTIHQDTPNPPTKRRFHMLASQRFQARLTLFPKYFAPFPHGTCSLSDSS